MSEDMVERDLDALCKRVVTWDQRELDSLVGNAAVQYAEAHEKDVRLLAQMMWDVFPLGGRWWKIRYALKHVFAKNAAIKARAKQIREQRAAGLIVERDGDLVFVGREDSIVDQYGLAAAVRAAIESLQEDAARCAHMASYLPSGCCKPGTPKGY